MTIQKPEMTLEVLLQQIDSVALELQSIRSKVEILLEGDISVENGQSTSISQKRSVVEVLADAPGHRIFRTAAEVDQYLVDERASWDS